MDDLPTDIDVISALEWCCEILRYLDVATILNL